MSLEQYRRVIGQEFTKDANLIDRTIRGLGLDPTAGILDIGTGMGAMSILLAMNGFDVLTGQPEHDEELDEHQAHGQEHGGGHDHHHGCGGLDWRANARALGVEAKIRFLYLDAEDLDLPAASFDAAFMYDTLQHIGDRERALNGCLRVVKPGGVLCVIEWNKRTIREDEERYGFTLDYVDPREILDRDDVRITVSEGRSVNVFVIRKDAP